MQVQVTKLLQYLLEYVSLLHNRLFFAVKQQAILDSCQTMAVFILFDMLG
jgi:hypothetical protein